MNTDRRVNDLTAHDAGIAAPGCPPPMITVAVVVGVAVLAALTIVGQVQAHPAMGLIIVDVAVAVASCALLPVLLRWPVTGGLAGGLALAVLAAVSPAATPAATAGALLVAQRRRFTVAAMVAAAGVAAHAVQGLWRPPGGLSFPWWLALMIAGYAALLGWGALTQARWALVASLRERARRAEADQGRRMAEARVAERTRIAREMHDVLAHRLSLIATYAGALEYRPDSAPEQLARAAGVVRDGVHQALNELREVISVLRDDQTTADEQTGPRPQPMLADIPRLVEESHDAGQQVVLDDRTADAAVVPAVAGRAAYRVVQEALTNARKHAAGRPVRVLLDGKPGTTLVIDISNPLPSDLPHKPPHEVPASPSVPGGAGLIGLTERVHLAGGRLDHEVTAIGEFHLHAWLPWPK